MGKQQDREKIVQEIKIAADLLICIQNSGHIFIS